MFILFKVSKIILGVYIIPIKIFSLMVWSLKSFIRDTETLSNPFQMLSYFKKMSYWARARNNSRSLSLETILVRFRSLSFSLAGLRPVYRQWSPILVPPFLLHPLPLSFIPQFVCYSQLPEKIVLQWVIDHCQRKITSFLNWVTLWQNNRKYEVN